MNSQPLQSFAIPGTGYGYTGAKIDTLASFENTLCMTLLDESGSTISFARQMETTIKEIIMALRRSPRASNLMYRQVHFGTNYREHHGYKPLVECNPDDYDGCYQPGGRTILYDASARAYREMQDYGERQVAMHYNCNGILFGLTDGCDYGSALNVGDVLSAKKKLLDSECLESIIAILIGVNPEPSVQVKLKDFADKAAWDKYIEVENADSKSLAKLLEFIVSQTLSQSQALGTGGASQLLTF